MLNKLLSTSVTLFTLFTGAISATEYEIADFGTLQTHSSEPIAINNEGQVLGWYNLKGENNGKIYYVRDRDGTFHEIQKYNQGVVNWRHLSNNGKVYGTFEGNAAFSVLLSWDNDKGLTVLGNLPNKEVSAINDKGQVLIKSIPGTDSLGRAIRYPVIWLNGTTTKLKGLEGDLGTESSEAYGLDMNNNGDVVGSCVVDIVYKNNVYKQTHATKWINGKAIDLHREVPKGPQSTATNINNYGDVIVNGRLVRNDGEKLDSWLYGNSIKTPSNYFLATQYHLYLDREGNQNSIGSFKEFQDYNCIWMGIDEIININDRAEIIGIGNTIYGERHAMLLTPKTKD